MKYPLRFIENGMIYMDRTDNCDTVVDIMLRSAYNEEFNVSTDWDIGFISDLMRSGFLVMSETFPDGQDIVLPKFHISRSVLKFPDLHIKKSVRGRLNRYEFRFDIDFELILDRCVEIHGSGWLTPSLLSSLRELHNSGKEPYPAACGVYRDGILCGGEFGVICGGVYTSYSGFKTENSAGTVQIIHLARHLEKNGFAFLDFGMPLPYKSDLGARNITPGEFASMFRAARAG